MDNKNLLLGYGETLVSEIPSPGGGGKKKQPYSFEESKGFLLDRLSEINPILEASKNDLLFENKQVVKVTLHPSFLAKSYYPSALFDKYNLKSIGSKSKIIKPRKQTLKEPKDSTVTTCLYVSGNTSSFVSLKEDLSCGYDFAKGVKLDIRKVEDLALYSKKDKIINIKKSKAPIPVEIALHSQNKPNKLLNHFAKFAKSIGVKIDKEKAIVVEGLVFIPALATNLEIENLSSYSFLRCLRNIPNLKPLKPLSLKTMSSTDTPNLPEDGAINEHVKVAVFDGGMDITSFDPWCEEFIFSNDKPGSDYLIHGQNVTSTILFGNIEQSIDTLPQPFSNIKHYRVLDSSISSYDDLYIALKRIQSVLETESFEFVNISLGPDIPIEDDEVNVWTSSLDPYFSSGKTLCTVAVGNSGELSNGLNRIQPPSDMVNAFAIGSSTVSSGPWERSEYSSVGPGRSPGFIKPDGLTFGGSEKQDFIIYNPSKPGLTKDEGTSLSAPLALRSAIGIYVSLQHDITPLAAKALMIHHAMKKEINSANEVGYGLLPHDISQVMYCNDNEAKIIYQGTLTAGKYVRALIPFPDKNLLNGMVTLKATFCFTSKVDPQHPINYSRSGLVVTFRPKFGDDEKSKKSSSFFNLSNSYATEQEQRNDAHKWEVSLHREKRFNKNTLNNPCFDINYQAREEGQPIQSEKVDELPYVLIVTVTANNSPDVYNNILQTYKMLSPIKVDQRIEIK